MTSINPYTRLSYYKSLQSESVAATNKSTTSQSSDSASTERLSSTDYIELSQEALEYLSGYQNAGSYAAPTGLYGNSGDEDELTVEQKKVMLSNMQSRLNNISSSQTTDTSSTSKDELFATLSEQLSDYDASTITDDQVNELFNQVTETLEQSRPAPPPNGQRPPRMEGDQPPPPPGEEGSTPPELTTEEKKSILTELKSKLDELASADEEEETEETDESDSLLSSLVEEIIQKIKQSETATEE